MNVIEQTEEFEHWLDQLDDGIARNKIVQSIVKMEAGNLGDSKPVGSGVSELRIHYGSGYRIYYKRVGRVIYLLLCGGTKKTQKSDIKRAVDMASQL